MNQRAGPKVPERSRETEDYVLYLMIKTPMEEATTMTTATLQKLVRDPRSGEVHLPHERVQVLGVMRNLDRILLRVKWQRGGDCILFPDDIEDKDRPVQSQEIILH